MWPFSKPETAVADPRQTAEYRAGFTDAVLDYSLRQASGNAGASATETAAVIFGMGCLQAAFSVADVEPEELRPTLTPMVLGAMAQQLALKGNSVWDILVNEGDPFPTLRAGMVETITGGPDPRGWLYQMAFEGPSATETLVRLYSDVIHARINTDPLKPWQGYSSLTLAGVTAATLANIEQRISEEANARVGYLLNYPDGTSDSTIGGIRGDVGSMRGGVMLAETGGAGFRAGLPGGNPSDWRKTRLGAEIPATSLQARTEAVRDVLGAMRVPAVLLLGGDGASYREGYRQFLTMGVNPMAEVVAEELSAKLGADVRFSFRRLAAADIASRARAMGVMVSAGLPIDVAQALADLTE